MTVKCYSKYPIYGLSGTFTSVLDTMYNLNLDKLYISIDNSNVLKFINITKEYFPNLLTKLKINDESIEADIIITTTDTIESSLYKLKCDKIIFLDTTGIVINHKKKEWWNKIESHKSDKVFLCNPYTRSLLKDHLDTYEYYHKFSLERLNHIKRKYIKLKNEELKSYGESGYYKIRHDIIHVHSYNSYDYMRHFLINDFYYENIGKILFEFCWLERNVFYHNTNKTLNDGLTYYLNLFNIDDNLSQKLLISKEEIEEKLTMKDSDLIKRLIWK